MIADLLIRYTFTDTANLALHSPFAYAHFPVIALIYDSAVTILIYTILIRIQFHTLFALLLQCYVPIRYIYRSPDCYSFLLRSFLYDFDCLFR